MPDTPPLDLSACEREPIHIPGSVQPHGCLLAIRQSDLTVVRASANVEQFLGRAARQVLGGGVDQVLAPPQVAELRRVLGHELLDANPLYLFTLPAAGGRAALNALLHRRGGILILEFEPAPAEPLLASQNLYPLVRNTINRLQRSESLDALFRLAADEVRRLTGFDKVMIYRFDADWTGVVVAESREPDMEPYLGHRFPASDIPRQARELYVLNRIRLIADAGYAPVPILPAHEQPLDLSFASLRAVSPVHVEYLRNMRVGASMSISVIREGQLWGLIALHHRAPKFVPHEVRIACDLLGQVLSLQLLATERQEAYRRRVELKDVQARLLAHMVAADSFVTGLTDHYGLLLSFQRAHAAAICGGPTCAPMGDAPPPDDLRKIGAWLADRAGEELVHTEALPAEIPDLAEPAKCTGLLAISLSKFESSYLVWFRPEAVRWVDWAGDPNKPAEPEPGAPRRPHPRHSFRTWRESVRGRSMPWDDEELAAARELRNSILGIVLRRAEELASLGAALERTNKELESFSYSVSHDLRAPFRHIVGFAELLAKRPCLADDETAQRFVRTITDSARHAGKLVDSLLSFSQMARQPLRETVVDLDRLVADLRREVEAAEAAGRPIDWRVGPLPKVNGDPVMLALAVRNLLSNAVKYTRTRERAEVEVSATRAPDGGVTIAVRDNGVGFDPRYLDKLFGVFQRLHRAEEFEGTGIGLANVRRTIERHGGRTWAEGEPDRGATFYFSLPDRAVVR